MFGVCDPNPCPQVENGACCYGDGSCALLAQAECTGNWLGSGTVCEPNPCPQPLDIGACCFGNASCRVLARSRCELLRGTFLPFTPDCDPDPCPQPTGSCCYLDGTCEVTLEADCTGQWTMFGVCDPNPCPQPEEGACCFIDGTCQVLTELRCTEAEGSWQGPGTGCDPNPCPPPVPVEKTSWGQIKSNYR